MTYQEMQARGKKLFEKHNLSDWSISIENLRNNFYTTNFPCGFWGVCDLEHKVIRIDWRVGRGFRQTMLHEIAHALVGRPGHDKAWFNKADEIGCTFKELYPYILGEDKP